MAFSLNTIGNQGNIPNYADLLAAAQRLNPVASTLASTGVTDTLSAGSIVGGVYTRSGATAAVAVTTDTAANIIAALAGATGQTFVFYYTNMNTSAGAATIAGGTGVTMSGVTVVPIFNTVVYMGTVTSATTVALNGFYVAATQRLPAAVVNTNSTTSQTPTYTAANVSGAHSTVLKLTGSAGGAVTGTLPLVTDLVAALSNPYIGQTWVLRLVNTTGQTITVTTNTGWTLTGTMTLALNTTRDFVVTLTSLTAATLEQIGTSTTS